MAENISRTTPAFRFTFTRLTTVEPPGPAMSMHVDRHGNVRVYVWRGKGHPKMRIREEPGTSAFRVAYDAAMTSTAAPQALGGRDAAIKPGTFRWLCVAYFTSGEFRELDPGTQRVRRGIIKHCCREPIAHGAGDLYADVPLDRFSARAVRVLRDRKAERPEAANGRVKAIRQVFNWALKAEPDLVAVNPARDVPYLRSKRGGHHAWTVGEVRLFEARHPVGTKARLALALCFSPASGGLTSFCSAVSMFQTDG